MFSRVFNLLRQLNCCCNNPKASSNGVITRSISLQTTNINDGILGINDISNDMHNLCIKDISPSIHNWKNTVPFVAPINKGLVIKVYDGDTITIAARLPYSESNIYRFSVRLNGIDCPEMKSNNEIEKECARLAKQYVMELLMNKFVILKNVNNEKYGRLLADVYINGGINGKNISVNEYLLEKHLAVKYDGKTKKCPENWMEYYNNR